ncbi:hypothetical protein F5Y16DRAFT_358865 [Xylariaceae sp. FL0255]|nr:hypothetical protein F5Y16DRAFT_358865 [Xylariaceae sp. FL0255]
MVCYFSTCHFSQAAVSGCLILTQCVGVKTLFCSKTFLSVSYRLYLGSPTSIKRRWKNKVCMCLASNIGTSHTC